eukprot:gene9931-2252_t
MEKEEEESKTFIFQSIQREIKEFNELSENTQDSALIKRKIFSLLSGLFGDLKLKYLIIDIIRESILPREIEEYAQKIYFFFRFAKFSSAIVQILVETILYASKIDLSYNFTLSELDYITNILISKYLQNSEEITGEEFENAMKFLINQYTNIKHIDHFVVTSTRNLFHFCQYAIIEGTSISEESFLKIFKSIQNIKNHLFKKEFESIIFVCVSTGKLKSNKLQQLQFLKLVLETDMSNDFLRIMKECIYRLSAKERVTSVALFSLVFKPKMVLNFILQNIICSDQSYEVRVAFELAIQQIFSTQDFDKNYTKEKLVFLCKMDPNKIVRLKSIRLLEKISTETHENIDLLILKGFDKDFSVRLFALQKVVSFGSKNIDKHAGKIKSKVSQLVYESLLHVNDKIKTLGEKLFLDYLQSFRPSDILEKFDFEERFNIFHPIIENNIQSIMEKEIDFSQSQEIIMEVETTIEESEELIEDQFSPFDLNDLSFEELIQRLKTIQEIYSKNFYVNEKHLKFLDLLNDYIEKSIKHLIEEFIEFENLKGWKNYRIEDFENRLTTMNQCKSIVSTLFDKHENSSTDSLKVLSELKKRKEKRKEKQEILKKQQDEFWNQIAFKTDNEQYYFFISKFGFIKGRKNYGEWKEVSILNKTTSVYSSLI